MVAEFKYSVYLCARCGKSYTVNEPGTWRQCTPDFCHGCYEHLGKKFCWIPVTKDGKDVVQ